MSIKCLLVNAFSFTHLLQSKITSGNKSLTETNKHVDVGGIMALNAGVLIFTLITFFSYLPCHSNSPSSLSK